MFKKLQPMNIILFGALIVILGGIVGAIGTFLHNRKNSAKTDRIETGISKNIEIGVSTNEEIHLLKANNDTLRNKVIESYDKLVNQEKTIDELRKENTDLYSKLANTSNEIYKNVTGGESYCYIALAFNRGRPNFFLFHVGDHVLRNVQINIEDQARRVFLWEKTLGKREYTQEDFSLPIMEEISKNTYYSFDYDALYPNTAINEFPIPIEPGQTEIRMRIWINLENGSLFETIHMLDINAESQIYSLELKRGDKILKSRG